MIKEYLVPVLIIVAALVVYNMVAKKLLNLSTFDDSYDVVSDGQGGARVVNMAA